MTGTPYEVLARYGVHAGITVERIEQLRERIDPAEEESWKILRNTETRLAVDFYMYRAKEPGTWLKMLVRKASGKDASNKHREVSAGDRPLLLLLMGEREAALKLMCGRIHKHPLDTRAAHDLAIFTRAEALQEEAVGCPEKAVTSWRKCIGFVCRSLADDDYWHQWANGRLNVYCSGATSAARAVSRLEEVREGLRANLARHFLYRQDQFQKANNPVEAAFADLEILLEIEWRAMRTSYSAAGAAPNIAPFGPLLKEAVGSGSFHPEELSLLQDDRQTSDSRPQMEQPGRTLRQCFSGLGQIALALEKGYPDQALTELRAIGPFHPERDRGYAILSDPADQFEADAVDLGIRCLFVRADAALLPDASPGTLRAVMVSVRRFGRERQREQEAIQAITRFAIDRSYRLRANKASGTTDAESISTAISVLDAAFAVVGGEASPELGLDLAKALQLRGVGYEKSGDYNLSYADHRRAWLLYPDNDSIVCDLCNTLVNWAADLRLDRDRGEARAKLAEAFRLLQGRNEPDCREVGQRAKAEQDILDGRDTTNERWSDLDDVLGEHGGPSLGDGLTDLELALDCLEAGDRTGAFQALRLAAPAALTAQVPWGRFSEAVLRLFEEGGRNEALSLIHQFSQEGAGHTGFRHLERDIRLAAEFL
jgi:hypothetical protein